MVAHTIIVEAASVEEAREKVKAQVPADLCILSEKIIDDGRVKARAAIPARAVVFSFKDASEPAVFSIAIEASDEARALAEGVKAASRVGVSAILRGVGPLVPGRKGFLGIGGKPGRWTAELYRPAVCGFTYRPKALVQFKLGKHP